jgi:hypothetical protein
MVRATSDSEDEAQKNDTDDGDDFEAGQPELKLSKEANAEVVDDEDCYQEDGNKDTRVDGITAHPELDNQGSSSKLIRSDDDILEPVSVE